MIMITSLLVVALVAGPAEKELPAWRAWVKVTSASGKGSVDERMELAGTIKQVCQHYLTVTPLSDDEQKWLTRQKDGDPMQWARQGCKTTQAARDHVAPIVESCISKATWLEVSAHQPDYSERLEFAVWGLLAATLIDIDELHVETLVTAGIVKKMLPDELQEMTVRALPMMGKRLVTNVFLFRWSEQLPKCSNGTAYSICNP